MREVTAIHNFTGREPFANRTLSQLGLPAFDLFVARSAEHEIPILIDGDRSRVLKDLAQFRPNLTTAKRVADRLEAANA
jgi:hypothetical protein